MSKYLFFPSQPHSIPSNPVLVGFKLPGIILVVALVREEKEDELDQALSRVWTTIEGPRLEILGRIGTEDSKEGCALGWEPDGSRIELRISTKGVPSHPTLQTIIYHPPNPQKHHFLALSPLELDVSVNTSFDSPPPGSLQEAMEASEAGNTMSRGRERSKKIEGSFREAIKLINASYSISLRLTSELQSKGSSSSSLYSTTVFPPSEPLSPNLQRLRAIPLFLLRLLHTRLPFGGPLLKDISATVNQIDVRAEQAAFLPTQLFVLSSSASSDSDIASGRSRYIHFYTTLWLIANDVIFGRAFGIILCEQNELFGHALGRIAQRYVVELPSETLRWLDDWPGGLKLNTDLSRFISSAFLSLIAFWDQVVLQPLLPHLPLVLAVVGLSGFLGTTMGLSLLADLLSILTAHLYVAYLIATVSFRWMKMMLGTLFNVFRGKRVNVLRNRLDSNDYTVDQLLLGTVLFTLFAFLFPTVLAYYLFFATSRFAVIFLHSALEMSLAFFNHFPLFAVMLRFKDPARLPGGIELRLSPPSEPPHRILQNQPIPLAKIFFQHLALVSRLSSHYSPIRLIRKLVAGETIRPIERFKIRY
ncbi:N-acetylglucosaminyl transferase component-domain-containing protein [Mrakia frigida]|uniref:phosphatidylinositol N-acetylglucosaminyltransferase n=1 Tax=Mrakia frigida TaxID=29902 RepID=UPI003FCC12C1